MINLTISIVLYKTQISLINRLLDCIEKSGVCKKLYLIDNSPEENHFYFRDKSFVEYIWNRKNNGYGGGHNIALRKVINESKYHLILNPDIYFESNILSKIVERIEDDDDIGLIMPKIIDPYGNTQYLCKLIPTPFDLFLRRFPPPFFRKKVIKMGEKYELRFTGYDQEMNVPTLSGCFMLLRMSALKNVGLFDERYFMYAEDIDLSRRIHEKYKTLYFPSVSVVHEHAKESYKSIKMLLIHVISIFKYFNKWGWLFDSKRFVLNNNFLNPKK